MAKRERKMGSSKGKKAKKSGKQKKETRTMRAGTKSMKGKKSVKVKKAETKKAKSGKRGIGIKIITTSTGSYPRIGDTPELQKLRRAWAKKEQGEISDKEYEDVVKEFTELAIREQEKAGVEIITDGMVSWYDQISHFARKVEGVKINGLLRFFDTNTYFRQPIIDGTPDDPEIKPVLIDEFRFAKSVAKRTLKPVITGPVTLAKLSKGDYKKALSIYTKLVENEVRMLSQEGAEYIQIDEPALERKDLEEAMQYLERIYKAKGENTKIIYFFYFRDFSKDYKDFQKIPTDILGFDMTYSKLEDVIEKYGTKKPLLLGIVDGRTTYIEKPKDVIPRIKKVLKNYPFDFIMVGPSCGLEYLPRKFAFMKLKNLVKIIREMK